MVGVVVTYSACESVAVSIVATDPCGMSPARPRKRPASSLVDDAIEAPRKRPATALVDGESAASASSPANGVGESSDSAPEVSSDDNSDPRNSGAQVAVVRRARGTRKAGKAAAKQKSTPEVPAVPRVDLIKVEPAGPLREATPLPATPSMPTAFFDRLIDRLNLDMLPRIDRWLASVGDSMSVCTVCSGSESPVLSLHAISNVFGKLIGRQISVKHVWSCEKDVWLVVL